MNEITKPAEIIPPAAPPDLKALANKINTEHRAIVEAAKSAVTRAIAAGEALIAAKAAVPPRQFGRWLEANTCVAERTAQLYMQIARSKLQIEGLLRDQSATVAGLTLTEAVKKIRDDRIDQEAAEAADSDPPTPPPPSPLESEMSAAARDLRVLEIASDLIATLRQMPMEVAQRAAARVQERLQEERLIDSSLSQINLRNRSSG